MYFPILITEEPDLDPASEALSLDFWYPLDEDPGTSTLCDAPGFAWQGRPPYGPFDGEKDDIEVGLLPAYKHLEGRRRSLPVWEAGDPLEPLYAVWLGSYPQGEAGDRLREAYEKEADVVTVPRTGDFPDLADVVTPATATGLGLTHTGDGLGAAVVLVGDDPADLARLWNARAMGAVVCPWPVAQAERFEPALRSWLSSTAVQERADHLRSGDGRQLGRRVAVCPGPGHSREDVERLAALISGPGRTVMVDYVHSGRGWTGHHPLQTGLEEPFTATVSRDNWHITVPVPQLGLGRPRRAFSWPGFVIADVEAFTESGLPPGRSLSAPAIRRLAPLLGQLGDTTGPFRRPTGEGRAVAVQASESSVTLGLVPTLALFRELFKPTGWKLGQSDDGRFATQLVERLSGTRYAAASQPAIRAVLYHASRADRAHPIARFIAQAEQNRGAWPEPLPPRSPRDYAIQVVYSLIDRGLLSPALQIRCPHCTNETDIRPEDVASELTCRLCGGEFALGSALATRRGKDPWAYELAASVPPNRIRSALPVMAALEVIVGHRVALSHAIPHILGLEVHASGWDCELDIAAAVVRGPASLVVVGEVKGGSDQIDANDISNLERVQEGLRASGVDTLILLATARDSFSPEERVLLRGLCDRAPTRLSQRGPSDIALPLVLVERDISTPWMSDDHPWRWGRAGGPSLAGMAEESCRRNLGLASAEVNFTPTGWVPRTIWRGE